MDVNFKQVQGIYFLLTLYWVSVNSVYHRLSWHRAIEWWNILIHIFVIIHFAPLFMWEWPNILLLYVKIFQRVRRQKVIIVNLLKVIVITELTKQIRRKTNMLLRSKTILIIYIWAHQNDNVILFMWAQQFGENILRGVGARAWL